MAMPNLPARLAQTMLNGLERINPLTPKGRVALRGWVLARAGLLLSSDPIVSYSIAGGHIYLPFSHDLPLIRKWHPQYQTNLSRLAAQLAQKYASAVAIDIGANIGDTILAIRHGAALPILAIEGYEPFFQLLERNLASVPDIELAQHFVDGGPNRIARNIHVLHGTAHISDTAENGPPLSSRPLADILHRHPRFERPGLLKVDTDGLDCAILEANLTWLAYAKPIVFFEYDPAAFLRYNIAGLEIFTQLSDAGYKGGLVWENTGDYLLAFDLNDRRLLEDIHNYYYGRGSARYSDIAVFHARDLDVMAALRREELAFFQRQRNCEKA